MAAFLALCLLATAAPGAARKTPVFTPEEQAFIKAHPVISFGDVTWEPLAVIKDGVYSGVFHDYYERIAQLTGLSFAFVPMGDNLDFQNVLDALREKRIDMIDGTGKIRQRGEYALFAGPFMRFPLAIAAREGLAAESVQALRGKRVAVARGSTAAEHLKEKHPDLPLVIVEDPREALAMVASGRADAMLDNLAVTAYVIREAGLKNVRIAGVADYVFDVYALVRDDWPLLASILEKAQDCLSLEERRIILEKWLAETAAARAAM